MELVYLILSVWIRFSPWVKPLSVVAVSGPTGMQGKCSGRSVWLPIVGWVAVSVQRSWSVRWLPWRVVAVHLLDRPDCHVEQKSARELLMKYAGWKQPAQEKIAPDFHDRAAQGQRSI